MILYEAAARGLENFYFKKWCYWPFFRHFQTFQKSTNWCQTLSNFLTNQVASQGTSEKNQHAGQSANKNESRWVTMWIFIRFILNLKYFTANVPTFKNSYFNCMQSSWTSISNSLDFLLPKLQRRQPTCSSPELHKSLFFSALQARLAS